MRRQAAGKNRTSGGQARGGDSLHNMTSGDLKKFQAKQKNSTRDFNPKEVGYPGMRAPKKRQVIKSIERPKSKIRKYDASGI